MRENGKKYRFFRRIGILVGRETRFAGGPDCSQIGEGGRMAEKTLRSRGRVIPTPNTAGRQHGPAARQEGTSTGAGNTMAILFIEGNSEQREGNNQSAVSSTPSRRPSHGIHRRARDDSMQALGDTPFPLYINRKIVDNRFRVSQRGSRYHPTSQNHHTTSLFSDSNVHKQHLEQTRGTHNDQPHICKVKLTMRSCAADPQGRWPQITSSKKGELHLYINP